MKIGDSTFTFFFYRSKINASKKAPIYCRISILQKIKLLSTGILISENQWKSNGHCIDPKLNLIDHLRFEKWKSIVRSYFVECYLNSKTPKIEALMALLNVKQKYSQPKGILEVFNYYYSDQLKVHNS
ncbi:MAG: hypothetical protein JPMHGGIA_02031 [Saprospiraceae bacterium]|nr:hypothetical protein [Saprospiraceae bacterium]